MSLLSLFVISSIVTVPGLLLADTPGAFHQIVVVVLVFLKVKKGVIKMCFEGLLLDIVAVVKSNVFCYERLWNLSIE